MSGWLLLALRLLFSDRSGLLLSSTCNQLSVGCVHMCGLCPVPRAYLSSPQATALEAAVQRFSMLEDAAHEAQLLTELREVWLCGGGGGRGEGSLLAAEAHH